MSAPARPVRPGFTAGTEEFRWYGKPALRSTAYLWAFSLGSAFLVSLVWGDVMFGIAKAVYSTAPGLAAAFFPHGNRDMAWWLAGLPWVALCLPAITKTASLMATSYELSTQRLNVQSGILVRTYDQLELFRIRDYLIDAPAYLSIMGLAHVRIISRDETLPLLTIFAQPYARDLVDLIRTETQRRKDEVGVREIETTSM